MSIFEYDEEKHRKHEREIGENRLGQLVSILIKEGKIEEAALVAEDAEKRKEYYEKYQIKE